MQTFKIILGIVLAIAAINVMSTMAGEEQGAGLAGAFTGFLILGGIALWLIYTGIQGNSKKQL